MTLSRRERIAALAAMILVGAWLADDWVVTPLWSRYQADVERAATLQQQVVKTERLLRRRKALSAEWRRRLEAGAGQGVSQAEGNLLNSLGRWASDAGLSVASMKPDREPAKEGLQVIRCRLTVNGRMSGVARFCGSLQSASIPVRVEKMQLAAADAARDALTVQLQLSTVCVTGGTAAATPKEGA